MPIEAFTRGTVVTFSATFKDKDGAPVVPPSANLYVAYKDVSGDQVATIIMNEDSGVFAATWDSSIAEPSEIYWHIRAGGPAVSARDGHFTLTANAANPAPVAP